MEIVRLVMPRVKDLRSIMPKGDLANYPWATVGNAVEFRMRQSCEVDYYATSTAIAMTDGLAVLHDALAVLWDKYKDDTWTRAEGAWVVYFAGVLEGIYRSGNADDLAKYSEGLGYLTSNDWFDFQRDMAKLRNGELGAVDADNYPVLSEMMNRMPIAQEVLDDIIEVSDVAIGSANFQRIRHSPLFVDNPIFSGGNWIGGADGDFLVGRCLFEVKTTVNPGNLLYTTLRQLIAYVALDSEDEYLIEEMAVFLPRQGGVVIGLGLEQVLELSEFKYRAQMQLSAQDAFLGGSK